MTPPAALGQFALGLAVTAPILIFAYQGLRELQATDARQEFQFDQYFRFRLVSAALALVGICALTKALAYPVVVIIIGISKSLESVCDLMYGKYQQSERMDWIAISMMLRGVASVVAVAVLLRVTHRIEFGAAGLIIANAGVLALYDWRAPAWLFRSNRTEVGHVGATAAGEPRSSFRSATYCLAILGLPLGLAQMLNSVSVNIPRYLLERHAGEASLGIFAAIMYLLVAGRTMIGALAQACVVRLARFYANGDGRAFRSLLFKQLGLAVGVGAAGILFSISVGSPFLRLVYRPEYAGHTTVLLLAIGTRRHQLFGRIHGHRPHRGTVDQSTAANSRDVRFGRMDIMRIVDTEIRHSWRLLGSITNRGIPTRLLRLRSRLCVLPNDRCRSNERI